MNNQSIFPLKSDGQLMDWNEAARHFDTLPVTEQDRILVLLQALIDAITAGVAL